MPGEWSKKIGETGESLVMEYLKMIGWANSQKGVDIRCAKSTKHRTSAHDRQSHGMDYIFSYPSPLLDGVLHNLLISVKFTTDTYPNSPTPLFKEYFTDLAFALECFKNSQQRNETTKRFNGINKAQDIGVLFWISGNKESYDDVTSKVANII